MNQNSINIPLSIQNVSKKFGNLWANKKVSFDVAEGKVIGLLGPNGAGKTTLIRICAGWLKPESGIVLVNNIPRSAKLLTFNLKFQDINY